jgi:hypothetical protein
LLTFGGWVVLTTIANGLLQTVDRLAIGGAIGPAAVAAYAIAYGLVSRVYLIPHGLSAALLPRYAAAGDEERARLIRSSIQAVAVTTTPAIIAFVLIVEPFFNIWIGPELTGTAAPIAYVLAGGFWIYCIAHMAYTMVQATGRPDRVGKLLMAEVIPYAAVLFLGMWAFGLVGAAAAFTLAGDSGFRVPGQACAHPGVCVENAGAARGAGERSGGGGGGGGGAAALCCSRGPVAGGDRLEHPQHPRCASPYIHKLRALLPSRGRSAP